MDQLKLIGIQTTDTILLEVNPQIIETVEATIVETEMYKKTGIKILYIFSIDVEIKYNYEISYV